MSRITNTVLPLSENSKSFLLEIEKSVERETHLINLLSDNLLYLTRVEEGRALTSRETPNAQQVRTYLRMFMWTFTFVQCYVLFLHCYVLRCIMTHLINKMIILIMILIMRFLIFNIFYILSYSA